VDGTEKKSAVKATPSYVATPLSLACNFSKNLSAYFFLGFSTGWNSFGTG